MEEKKIIKNKFKRDVVRYREMSIANSPDPQIPDGYMTV